MKVVQISKAFLDTFFDRQVQFHSAALAFYSIIALPSFLLLFVSISALVLSESTVLGWLNQTHIPHVQLLKQGTVQFLHISSITTVVSALLLVWSGSAMFQRIQYGLRDMWQIEVTVGGGVRTFLANRLLAIIAALIFVVAIIGLFFFTQIIGVILTTIDGVIPGMSGLLPIAGIIQFILLFGLLTLAYGLFGDSDVSPRLLLGSSTVVALIMLGIQYLSQQLIDHLFTVYWYGTASSIVLLLVLVYALSMTFYTGSVWMYVIAKQKRNHQYIRPREYARKKGNSHTVIERLTSIFS